MSALSGVSNWLARNQLHFLYQFFRFVCKAFQARGGEEGTTFAQKSASGAAAFDRKNCLPWSRQTGWPLAAHTILTGPMPVLPDEPPQWSARVSGVHLARRPQ
jgi:hypothetical protein